MRPRRCPGPVGIRGEGAVPLNFAKYIDWPEEAFLEKSSPIVINVLGGTIKDHLKQAVAGKHINGRDIVIRHPVTIREAGDCHILFVSSSEKSQAEELLSGLHRRPVVTVGEQEQFLQKGGIINFIMKRWRGKVCLETSPRRPRHPCAPQLKAARRRGQRRGQSQLSRHEIAQEPLHPPQADAGHHADQQPCAAAGVLGLRGLRHPGLSSPAR
ncbi:MAG: YfiR family protein [Verrucomicrobiota bacterium]